MVDGPLPGECAVRAAKQCIVTLPTLWVGTSLSLQIPPYDETGTEDHDRVRAGRDGLDGGKGASGRRAAQGARIRLSGMEGMGGVVCG